MTFEDALKQIKQDSATGMRLPQWNKDVIIACQRPDENSKMTHPYLYVHSRFGNVPWKETFVEMFSDEWETYTFIQEDGYINYNVKEEK